MNQKSIMYVYIDGFNLYHGSLLNRSSGRKWLNPDVWIKKILQNTNPQKITYFTARVSGRFDVDKPGRQQLYWRALKTIPNIKIVEGTFLMKTSKIQITRDVAVIGKVPEEKGTDVNIALHVLHDAHLGKYDTAVIISNDSDLSGVVRIVTQELGKKVGIINPSLDRPFNKTLIKHASFKKSIREHQILSSQFSETLHDDVGTFFKPKEW